MAFRVHWGDFPMCPEEELAGKELRLLF